MNARDQQISIHISDLRERAARAEERSAIAVDRLNAHAHRLKHHMDLMLGMEQRLSKRIDKLERFWVLAGTTVKYGMAFVLAGMLAAGQMTAENVSVLFKLFAP